MNLSKEQTHILFNIQNEIEWFNAKSSEAFHALYIDDCKTDSERALVIDLIRRVEYINNEKYHKILETFVKEITNKFKEEDTLVVVTAMDSSIDSSQTILYEMKPKFKDYGWNKFDNMSNLSKIGSKAFDPNQKNKLIKKNIIIVDEFIGTGQTMLNKVDFIKKQFESKKVECEDYNISIYSVSGTEEGLYTLIDNNINYRCEIELARGISDKYDDEEKYLKIKDMERLESLLSEYDGECELAKMNLGYGKSEALFKRENGNTPNNVFPIFWWSSYIDNSKRNTLMTRMC